MHDAMIRLSDIHVQLVAGAGEVNILRGISFHVQAGETVSIVGPSGSGKTTTLMVMAGLERPTSGLVHIAGQDITSLSEDALARFRRRQLGIVFQSFHLVPTMTALENIALPLEFARVHNAYDRAYEALRAVGLQERAVHYPAQLSGGEQQRVALARAFAGTPKVILADEPTGNLDTETGQMVIEHLFRMQQEHKTTLVLITHDISLAQACSRQVRIESGRMQEV